MKKALAIILALMLVLSMTVAACADDLHFEIVSKGFQHQYWQAVLKGAEEKAAELGVTINFVGPASESDYDEQLSQLNSAIAAKPAAIGLAALSTETCLDAIATAQGAGIPIIGFDSGVPGAPEGSIWANAATNNYNAGAMAAEKMYEAVSARIAAAEGAVRIGVSAQDNVSVPIFIFSSQFSWSYPKDMVCSISGVSGSGRRTYPCSVKTSPSSSSMCLPKESQSINSSNLSTIS